MTPMMSLEEVVTFLDREFPQMHAGGRVFFVDEVSPGGAVMRMTAGEAHLRPGGTVSGPALMTLADLAAYALVLAHAGPIALAVTTSLNINFLKKPSPGDLLARTRLLKLGKRLAVVNCEISGQGDESPCAQASITYSLPPKEE